MSDWWKNLTLSEKKDYIKQHPRSKKKIQGNNKTTSNKAKIRVSGNKITSNKPLSPAEKERAVNYLKLNGYSVKQAMSGSLDDMQRSFERKIERLENRQIKNLYDNTIKAVKLDKDKAAHGARQVLAVSGITLLATMALSLVLGTPVASTAAFVVAGFGDNIKRHTMEVEDELRSIEAEEDQQDFENEAEKRKFKAEQEERKRRAKIEYLKKIHEDMMKQAKGNLNDDDTIAESLVKTNEQSTETAAYLSTIDRSAKIKNISMKEKISINSSHDTDLLKALIKLEKADIISKEGSHEELLSHIDYLESCIPTAATIMVASIGKPSILSRAKIMLNKCNLELANSKVFLNKVSETASIKKSSLDFFLKKNLKPKEYKFEKAYVYDGNDIKPCEHHILYGVENADVTHNKIEIYGFVTGNTINLSLVKDSNFMPKSFSSIKPRELSSWLKEHL